MKMKQYCGGDLVRKDEKELVPSPDKELSHLVTSARSPMIRGFGRRTDRLNLADVFKMKSRHGSTFNRNNVKPKKGLLVMQKFKTYAASQARSQKPYLPAPSEFKMLLSNNYNHGAWNEYNQHIARHQTG